MNKKENKSNIKILRNQIYQNFYITTTIKFDEIRYSNNICPICHLREKENGLWNVQHYSNKVSSFFVQEEKFCNECSLLYLNFIEKLIIAFQKFKELEHCIFCNLKRNTILIEFRISKNSDSDLKSIKSISYFISHYCYRVLIEILDDFKYIFMYPEKFNIKNFDEIIPILLNENKNKE